MLAGIGGRTVAEAKARLTWAEFHAWMAYRAAHGPLHLQPRLDHGAALVAYTVSSTIPRKPGSRRPKFDDFMPYHQSRGQSDAPIDLATAMKVWR